MLAAAAKPPVAMDPNVRFLGCLDGTGVTTGTAFGLGFRVSLTEVLQTFRDIVWILSGGGKVLISCKNDAHRSSLLVALFMVFTCLGGRGGRLLERREEYSGSGKLSAEAQRRILATTGTNAFGMVA